MKKRLNEDRIINELTQGSSYFRNNPSTLSIENVQKEKPLPQEKEATKLPSKHGTVIPQDQGTIHEEIRKAMKVYGKEAATHRFTSAEKAAMAEIIFAYTQKGIRTNENEITRIAINFIIKDYRLNKKKSTLHNILKLINN
jgi:hypothetical protein